MTGKYLITTDAWFLAPDGQEYKAVWGEVEILSDNFLGIKTNARSANWFAKVGSEENHVIIAGCQIHYAAKSEERPSSNFCETWTTEGGNFKSFKSPSRIYFAE